jgi:hypothetical protein
VLRRIFGPKRVEVTGSACGAHEGGERFILHFGWEA